MDIVSKRFCMLYILQVQNTVDNLMNKKMAATKHSLPISKRKCSSTVIQKKTLLFMETCFPFKFEKTSI